MKEDTIVKKINRRSFLKAMGVVAAAGTLAACGGSSNNSGSTAASSGAGSAAASAAPATQGDGILTIAYGTAIDSLTPFRANTGRDAPYLKQIFEALAILNSDHKLDPWVAKEWTTDDNGFTYVVTLNEGVKDSAGNPYTADDVVWFIEESKARALKPIWTKVDSISKIDDTSVEIKLTSNIVGAIETVLQDTYVVTKAAFEASSDEFGTACVTTSPYKVTEFTASSTLSLEKRDDYWQDVSKMPEVAQANVDKINYITITEASQMGIALETGKVDLVINMDISTGAQFVDRDGYTVDMTEGPQGWTLFFSGADNSPCANDVALRQAICYSIDQDGLLTGLCSGYGTHMWDAHSPLHVGFNEKWRDEDYYDYSVDKAKEKVAESSYAGQSLKLLCSSNTFSQRLAQMIQSYLMEAGINCELLSGDMAYITSVRLDGTKYDMFINTIGGTYLPDAWSIRYDPKAYSTGDATSRHDYELGDLLYQCWTPEGWTEENIDKVHYYLKDNAIAYGLLDPYNFCIWRNEIGVENVVHGGFGYIAPAASTYSNY